MLQTISNTYRSWAFRVTVWLLLAGIMAGLTFMVWVASAVKPDKTQTYKRQDNTEIIDPLILITNQKPAEMQNLVQPVKFDAIIRDMRNYPKEFKDLKFVKENQSKWTLQIMNVIEHEVITDYLNNRGDREQFTYFRIVDKQHQKRYVLTYGMFANTAEAINASRAIDFGLPDSVSVFPEGFKSYENIMDEYEITPPVQDLSAKRDVKLQRTSKENPAKPEKPKSAQQSTQFHEKKSTSIERPMDPKVYRQKQESANLNIEESRRSNSASADALASGRQEHTQNTEKRHELKTNDNNKSQALETRQENNKRQGNNENLDNTRRQEPKNSEKPLHLQKAEPPRLVEEQTDKQKQPSNNSRSEKQSSIEREKSQREAEKAFPVVNN